jgi:hypothetical protein
MGRASKKKAPPKSPAVAKPVAITVALEPNGEQFYANFAEVTTGQHEFQISFALVPTKPTAKGIEAMKTGVLSLDAMVQVMVPPTLIPGLIRALTTTKEQHEAMVGPIKELGVPNE